jgi:hypothetical protein
MRHNLLGTLVLLAFLPGAWALDDPKDEPKPDKKPTPAEEFRSLVKDYAGKQQEVMKA